MKVEVRVDLKRRGQLVRGERGELRMWTWMCKRDWPVFSGQWSVASGTLGLLWRLYANWVPVHNFNTAALVSGGGGEEKETDTRHDAVEGPAAAGVSC